jgi:hypothetical protein
MKRIKPLWLIMTAALFLYSCQSVDSLIEKGKFNMAAKKIDRAIASGSLTPQERISLENQKERMRRIEMDFNKSREDILPYIQQYYPDVSKEQMSAWEESRALEKMRINGKDRYFARAAQNLFRIDAEAKKQKIRIDGEQKDGLDVFLEKHIPAVLQDLRQRKSTLGKPVNMKLTYTLTVDADAVPDGEMLRCWLPYPREGNQRQTGIALLSANCDAYTVAPNSYLQRTLYMQKKAKANQETVFQYSFKISVRPQWFNLTEEQILPFSKETELYKTYTAERDPHLLFTPAIRELSEKIIGDEKDTYQILKKIFGYISENYPWASAREYSTIKNIPEYVINHQHGDCGQVTLLFMALARYNGIPARWQSGWMLHPGEVNLHDWCEIYLEGMGWVPVDQSFGRRDTDEKDIKWFYLGGIDAYRLIINDDYGMPLYPDKQFMRSETVDFQRGEVEWRGGNLYFDQWDYHMEVEYLNQ